MTSYRPSSRVGVAPDGVASDLSPRLALQPRTPPTAFVDGAWWPRSTELPAELPALLEALTDRLADVVLVGYHVGAWDPAPADMRVDGRLIHLQEFTAEEPHTVLVIGAGGSRIALLVVSPNVDDATAHQALAAASAPSNGAGGGEARDTAARALAEVVSRLARHEGADSAERTAAITRWVSDAAHQFDHAPVQSYVPILVEHIVRGRMAATSGGR